MFRPEHTEPKLKKQKHSSWHNALDGCVRQTGDASVGWMGVGTVNYLHGMLYLIYFRLYYT